MFFPPPLPSPSDLILFNDLNEQLSTTLTTTQGGASELFSEKSFPPFTGMTNQGTTCYLNSLIQSLFFLSPFREAVFKWRHSPELHGSQSDSIPLQLQRLFGRLAFSPHAAVDSTDLTTSFGWEGEEAFVQHDAQELMRVLFEALKLSDTFSEGEAISFSSLLPQLFSGVWSDILKCSQCGHMSIREDLFYDICLPVQGMQVTTSGSHLFNLSPASIESATFTPLTSLHRSLRSILSVEYLTGFDQWRCSGTCNGARVDATKSFSLTTLPSVMTIHLKRFSYNASTGKYAKVNDPFSFPLEVDFDGFLADAKVAVLSSAAMKAESNEKPPSLSDTSVASALPSTGGSARAAVQALRARRISLESDSLATLSKGEVFIEEEGTAGEKSKLVTCDNPHLANSPVESASSAFSAPDTASNISQNGSFNHYELYSILMHSGVTTRGHYFAFIRSPQETSSSSTSTWLLMNDSTVLPLTESEVLTASGATTGLPEEYVSSMYGSSDPSGNAKSIPPGGSPYMLLYRRKNFLSVDNVSLPISLPQSVREAVHDSALIAYGDAMGCGHISSNELTDLAIECKSFNALKDCHRVRQLLCKLRVRIPKLALSRDDETEVLREASQHMQSPSTETATIYRLPFFEDDAGQPDFSSVFVPLTSSIDSATAACYSLLKEAHGGKNSFKKRNCLIDFPKLTDIRLRKFDAHTKKKTESYSHSEAPSTPFEAHWGLAVDVAIEVRAPVDAIQLPWPDYNPEAISVRVLKWKGSSLIQETITRLSSIAEGTACGEDSSVPKIPLDGQHAAILELSGTGGSPATVETLFTSLVDNVLDPTVSCSPTIPKTIHAVILPGGLPTPSDIASGLGAGRLRQRMSPAPGSCLTPHHTSLRVITIPIAGDESDNIVDVASLMNMELSKSFGLCDGDDLIILEETDDDIVNNELERSLPTFKSLFSSSTIRVSFKAMNNSMYHSDDASDQIFTLTARRDETLLSLKRRMIETINASSLLSAAQLTSNGTHLKRSIKSPMLRDEDKTLRELDIGDGAILFNCEGPVLINDTTHVRVFLHSAKQQVICTVPVKLSSRASALKTKIFETLTTSSFSLSHITSPPPSANHIRLRGRQTAAGASSTSILRDEAVLRQALGVAISYSGGDDERDVFVEFLENPETFGKNDLLIRVTEFIKGVDGTGTSSHLTPLIDMVLPKTSTLGSLSSLLTGREGCSSVIRLAKHSAYGPALNAWEAENKIRFVTINYDVADVSVCDPPLGLRDGCTMLWRRDMAKEDENHLSVNSESSGIEDNKENSAQREKKTSSAPLKKPWLVKKGTKVTTVEETSSVKMGSISIRVKGISE
jgi:ubiquitin C-terminal hydrolase